MFVNKWATFSSCILLALAGGSGYCWALYSGALKTAFQLSQSQLEELSNPLVPQLILSWLPGLGVGYLCKHHRSGPRLALLIGVLLNLFGNVTVWMAATGRLSSMPLYSIVWLGVIGANGTFWFDVAAMTVGIANFPQHRGTVVGIMKACYGISASMFSVVYTQAFDPNGLAFMLFITLSTAALGLLALPTFNSVPFRQAHENAGPRFILAYAIVAGIAVYQPLAALLTHLAPHIGLIHVIVLAGLVLPLLPALFIPWGTGGLRARPIISVPLPASAARSPLLRPYAESGTPSAHQGAVYLKAASPQKADALQEIDQLTHEKVIDASLPGDASLRQADEGAHGGEGRAVESQPAVTSLRCHLVRSDDIVTAAQEDREEIDQALHPGRRKAAEADDSYGLRAESSPSLLRSLASINFWLLFVIFGTGTGCGLLLLLNLGQLVESLGGGQNGAGLLLSLFAVFNSLGRILAGWLPEHMLHTHGTPRTVWLIVVAGGSTVSTTLAGLAGGMGSLRSAAPLAGVVYGSFQALMPVLASELFDMQRFATLYVVLQQATLTGSYLLANRLAGALYDQKAEEHLKDPNVCIGADCFRDSFLIAAALQALSTVLAGVLYVRTQALYKRRALEVHSADLIDTFVPESSSMQFNS